jgi:ribonuclease P protein component
MYRLPKKEKLCSRTKIEQLFADGHSFAQYPLRIVYRIHPKNTPEELPQFFISVPKRKFKRAVKRVWLRRRIREAYRLNKHIIPDMGNKTIDMAFL